MNRFALIMMVFLGGVSVASADLDDRRIGTRSSGMANAFSALADDASAIEINPAGLSQIASAELLMTSERITPSLSDGSNIGANGVALIQPVGPADKQAALAFGYQGFQGAGLIRETMVRAGGARNVPVSLNDRQIPLFVGVGLSYFRRNYEANTYSKNSLNDAGVASGEEDPFFSQNGYATSRFGLDIGVLARLNGGPQKIGLSISNLLQKQQSSSGNGNVGPQSIRLGWSMESQRTRWAVEARRIHRLANKHDLEAALGIEQDVVRLAASKFMLRGGYENGSRGLQSVSAGFSLAWKNYQLDYAYVSPLGSDLDTGANQKVSFVMRFDRPRTVEGKVVLSQNAYLERKKAGASVQERLTLLQDMIGEFGPDEWTLNELSEM